MTELQIILLVCAVVFVGALYWWGKKNNQQQMQRPFTHDAIEAESPEQEGFEVIPVIKKPSLVAEIAKPEMSHPTVTQAPIAPLHTNKENPVSSVAVQNEVDDGIALTSRMAHVDVTTQDVHVSQATDTSMASEHESVQGSQSQLFALLVLSPSRELSRKHVHAAMEASRLSFHHDGTYVHRDATGNIVFRVANVVEPGFFPNLEDDSFSTPGIALVLELPSSITPYRAMDEFITVARKVSQNVGGKLYDAQRHLIKESDLKAMREYAQSLTY